MFMFNVSKGNWLYPTKCNDKLVVLAISAYKKKLCVFNKCLMISISFVSVEFTIFLSHMKN